MLGAFFVSSVGGSLVEVGLALHATVSTSQPRGHADFFFNEHRPSTMSSQGGSASMPRLCTSFAKGDSLDPFYSGGAVALTTDASWIAATFGSDVHVVDVSTSRILHKLPGVCIRRSDHRMAKISIASCFRRTMCSW